MGGYQGKECGKSCKHYNHNYPFGDPCFDWNNEGVCPFWKSTRGRKTGSKSKEGSNKPGPKTKPSGQLKIWIAMGFTKNDIEAYGGLETLKVDVKKMVNDKIK